jgi:hypothetical protein
MKRASLYVGFILVGSYLGEKARYFASNQPKLQRALHVSPLLDSRSSVLSHVLRTRASKCTVELNLSK